MSEAEKPKKLTLIAWSDDLDKVYPQLILATTAAAYDVDVTVFVTFWGLFALKRNDRFITGHNWMTKMLSMMNRGGSKHLKLSKMHMMGMGTWMMNKIFKNNKVASLDSLLEMAILSGVKFIP